MVKNLIGVALVTLLFAGAAALEASAQSTGTPPAQAPVMAPSSQPAAAEPTAPAAKTHAAAKHRARPVAKKEAPAEEAPAPVAGLAYPPCSRTVKDQCIQLWQRNLSGVYPQCSKVKGTEARAACIEDAYKQSKG